jgi:hypothetical protein
LKTLYIIGNGFDLHHNLNTSYADFHKFVIENDSEIENFFEEYFKLEFGKDSFWKNFEVDLGTFNAEHFFDNYNHIDPIDEGFRPSFCFCLEDDLNQIAEEFLDKLKNLLFEWILEIEISSNVKLNLDSHAYFLSFNYTHVLEDYYQINKKYINHIHGDYKNNIDLIIGHNGELNIESDLDDNGDSSRTFFTDSKNISESIYFSLRKPVKEVLKQNAEYFNKLQKIENVFVLGHSLGEVDLPYFDEINKHVANAFWHVSYHNDHEIELFLNKLVGLGIKRNKIRFDKIGSLL